MEKEELDSLVSKILEKDKKVFNWDEIAEAVGAEIVSSQEKSEILMTELERRGISIQEVIPDLPEEDIHRRCAGPWRTWRRWRM